MKKIIAAEKLDDYKEQMNREELSGNTIKKYCFDVEQWLEYQREEIDMESMLEYKRYLVETYSISSVNSKLISINRYLKWLGHSELVLKTRRTQNKTSIDNMIAKDEYNRMLEYAKDTNRMKMYYIMRAIALTGIRIGELKYITVEALKTGVVEVYNKGKYRTIYFSSQLSCDLLRYCEVFDITEGVVFCGKNSGKCISTVGVWKNMKYIAEKVGVPAAKVYPHSLRHLFAKTYMEKIGDVTELSDLLGHSRLETTWIYTKTTSDEKRSRLGKLDL